ncbi:MAG: VWA domain-containing protein [Aquificaceae bacterium]|nr:VWA domain-containing protein [Aquificaceae bacterium]MCX7989380.1 VWA domain-containing protein [Aquificaceae bacterium]MDW8032370.1 vWA domain-containing protein [Aquificaceae bacterium]
MKERWKVIERHLSEEYGIEVQPNYEGWGAGYDPMFLPLTEMWAKGEMEEVPEAAKRPAGVAFYIQELSKKTEEEILNTIRHEIEYLFSTDLYLWKLGQREFYRFGFTPTSFLVLYALLESIKVDQKLLRERPSAQKSLQKRYEELLKGFDNYYPHHLFALTFLKGWLGKERMERDKERLMYEYLMAENREAYDILMEDLLGKYMAYIERSQELNYIDLLLEEVRGKVRKDAHRGRIMTDLLKKLPESVQAIIVRHKEGQASDVPEAERKEILRSLKSVPDWMRDYLRQMSYIDLVERDVEFIRWFLPKTLEVDIEHRGFLSFIVKGWEEQSSSFTTQAGGKQGEKSEEDRLYEKTYGLGKEEFLLYRKFLSNVMPYLEAVKRRLRALIPVEEEGWSGKHFYGRRLNNKALGLEVSIGRGRVYMRREENVRKELAFKLLIDISTSMKREEKIKKAIEALILFSEVIDSLKMPFSIDVFSDRVFRLKDFQEDYRSTKVKILSLFNSLGGGTNLEKGLLYAFEDLELFSLKKHIKGCMVVFSDGEPTKGLKGRELKELINQMKAIFPTVGIGVGMEKNYVDYYFESTGVKIRDLGDLTLALTRIIENQARRLLSFQ